jgi:hypothetical protein
MHPDRDRDGGDRAANWERGTHAEPAVPGGPDCPYVAELMDHALGRLAAGRRAAVEDHLAECDGCRRKVDRYRDRAPAAAGRPGRPGARTAGDLLAKVLRRFWAELRREARSRAEQRLTVLIAELGERFGATSAWLFDRRGDALEAIITHRTRKRHLVMRVGERGIVPHVAETCAGYYTNNVAADPYYRDSIPGTRSELAVPVIALDGELLGVLNLESRLADAFRPAQLDELQAAASALIPHLRVLAALDDCPWHPEVHGWDLTGLFQRFCHAVVRGLNQPDEEDTASCTIWYADWAKEELFVYATSSYDTEYVSQLTLPARSFTGTVAASPPWTVWDTTPDEAPNFRRPDKARQTGVRRILAAPICLPPGDGRPERGVSTLNLYSFADRPEGHLPAPDLVRALADRLGRIIDRFRDQRRRLATAYLHQSLLVEAPSSQAAFRIVRDVLMHVFDADGCTVFAHDPAEGRLYCATTTGLDEPGDTVGGPGGEVFYDLNADDGFTTYLARQCGRGVRKNDVLSTTEKGLPADFPPLPLNKYREQFARSETEHRRFLGIGCALRGAPEGADEILGVFRLNRASSSRPFTWCDTALLEDLAGLELCKKAFLDWRARRLSPPPGPALSAATGPGVVDAVVHLLRPVPALGSPQTLTDELLQALVVIFREHRIHGAGLVVVPPRAKAQPVRWQAYHSEYHKNRPGTSEFFLAETASRLFRPHLFERRKIVTFDHAAIRCEDGHAIVSEAWVPVVSWNGRHLLEGFLALSFQTPSRSWTGKELELFFRASQKLSAILASTPHVIRPECFQLPAPLALEQFLSFPQEYQPIAAAWSELRLQAAGRVEAVARPGPVATQGPDEWRPLSRSPGGEEAAFGVQERVDRRAVSFPLLLGPYAIGELRCGFPAGDSGRGRDELIRTVPGLWARLTSGLSGVHKFWEIHFSRNEIEPGIAVWDESFALGRVRPDVSRPLTPGQPRLVTDFAGAAGN